MRKLLILSLIFSSCAGICQYTVKIREIDSLVNLINASDLLTTTDTIINEVPAFAVYAKTIASITVKDSDIVKYNNKVLGIDKSGPQPDTINTLTIFYFHLGKLIKVEDSGIFKGKSAKADWYYFNDQPVYYTLKNERSEDRAQLLLVLAKKFQDQYHKSAFGKKE
ncbi:MAG: hypothetical protein HZB42_06350 [Sphingobacteriales bacterium]|nr:hypothetical protein [Sphingobacteriales bacterium]